MIVTTVFDKVSEAYSPLGTCRTEADAVRQFGFMMKNIRENPEIRADYELYCIGDFDDVEGVVVGHNPVLLASGESYLPKPKD